MVNTKIKDQRSKIKDRAAKKLRLSYFVFRLDSNGMSLVEVIMSVAVFVVIVSGLFSAVIYGREAAATAGQRARAIMVAREGIEAARDIDFNGLRPLADDTDATAYGLATTGCSNTCWALVANTPDTTDGFTRSIQLAAIDQNTREITVNVTWSQNSQRPYTASLKTRVTNWVWTWQNGLVDGQLDIATATATSDGKKAKVLGDYAYMIRGNTTNDLRAIQIANNGTPLTTPVNAGGFTLAGTANNIEVGTIGANRYAFITLAGGNPEVQIINITNPASMSQTSTINPAGNIAAQGIDFDGQYVYFGRPSVTGLLGIGDEPEFYVYDVSTPASPAARGTFTYGGTVNTGINDVIVLTNVVSSGDCFAYIATTDTANEVQVVTCTNRSSLTNANLINLSTAAAATSVNAYRVAANDIRVLSGSGNNFFATDLTGPATATGMLTSAAFAAGSAVTDISKDAVHGYAFVASGTSGSQLRVINVDTITSGGALTLIRAIAAPGTPTTVILNGVTYSQTLDRVVAVGTADNAEIIVASPR